MRKFKRQKRLALLSILFAFIERGRLASIRNFKGFLSSIKHYFFFLCKYGGILNTCPDILIRNRRIFCLNLLIGHSGCKGIKDNKNRNTCSFDTWFPVTYSRVYGYSFKKHILDISNFVTKSKIKNGDDVNRFVKKLKTVFLNRRELWGI